MANTRSAEKAARVTRRRTEINRRVISSLRSYIKIARSAIESGDAELAQKSTRLAITKLDKAGARGYVHRNKVARSKSRLVRQLDTLLATVTPAKPAKTAKRRTKTKTAAKGSKAKAKTTRKSSKTKAAPEKEKTEE